MAVPPENYRLHLAWCKVWAPDTNGTEYFLPVDSLRIIPKPVSQGSTGETVVTDVNNTTHYRCEGWRHDVELQWQTIPEEHHSTLQDLITDLHSNAGGEAEFAPAASDGSYDAAKIIPAVAKFDSSTLPVEFEGRTRRRGAQLMLQGKSLVSEPYSWISN